MAGSYLRLAKWAYIGAFSRTMKLADQLYSVLSRNRLGCAQVGRHFVLVRLCLGRFRFIRVFSVHLAFVCDAVAKVISLGRLNSSTFFAGQLGRVCLDRH